MKNLLWLMLLTCNLCVLHAQKFNIDGKVIDLEKKPVENTTVYLLKQKDSSIVNYTSTNKEGKFSLKTNEIKEPCILRVDADKLSSYTKIFDKINQSFSLGNIELEKDRVSDIEEVKISVSPIKIKKDTIEFNARAIKVGPDSNIDELLKNINGVEIDNNGKITVNGKLVDKILINGKPFFDSEGKIALKNLPADVIKNIQFTTTKSTEEEMTGRPPKSNNTTINLNIDEKKNKGIISKITLGYGSDKRYDGNALLNYFKNKTRINLIASAKNTNSQNSDDDTGGSVSTQGNNTKGIRTTSTIGVNYNDDLSKNIDLDALGIRRSTANTENASKVSRTTFLPDYILKTNSENNSENESERYSINSSVKIKLDSLSEIRFSPTFSHSTSASSGRSNSTTFKDDSLLNQNESSSNSEQESNMFSPNISFVKRFRKKGRSFYTNINTSISESKSNNFTKSQTVFYQNSDLDDYRNQLTQSKQQTNSYYFSANYSEPITDSLTMSFGLRYDSKNSSSLRNVNDFNESLGQYSNYNLVLSNSSGQTINRFSPELTIWLDKQKFDFWGTFNFDLTGISLDAVFDGQYYDLNKNFALPNYNLNFTYHLSKETDLRISNSANFSILSDNKLIPYTDSSNPLITYMGNPNLKNSWNNTTSLNLSNNNLPKNISYNIDLGFNYTNNDATNFSYYDESGKQFVTYTNISGNKSMNLKAGLSKTFKWGNSTFVMSPKSAFNYRYNKGFINGQLFVGNSYTVTPGISLNYDLKDKINIRPSYNINYSFSNYKNYSIESIKNTFQTFRLELLAYFLKTDLFFENGFEYNTSSNIASGFKRDFYFWNSGLGYKFHKKQFTAKVNVYDVLNQNQSVRRLITDSYFEDREDLILRRYVMFSFTMKLNKFGGKKM